MENRVELTFQVNGGLGPDILKSGHVRFAIIFADVRLIDFQSQIRAGAHLFILVVPDYAGKRIAVHVASQHNIRT